MAPPPNYTMTGNMNPTYGPGMSTYGSSSFPPGMATNPGMGPTPGMGLGIPGMGLATNPSPMSTGPNNYGMGLATNPGTNVPPCTFH
jgi:hypothetical protein